MIVKVSDYETIIDDADFENFLKITWNVRKHEIAKGRIYFQGHIWVDGKRKTTTLHRYLMRCTNRDGKYVDHIDGNTLNNSKSNLRVCTNAENCRNQKRKSNNTSGYKGVSYHKLTGKWQAQIRANGKVFYLGVHLTPELAYEVYCKAVPLYHGEFGRIE